MFFKNKAIKILCLSFFLFYSLISNCQKSEIFKNVNVLAKELDHKLNETSDSLVLKGERTIYKVEILNSEFSREFKYNSNFVKVPISDLPIGRYTVSVRLQNKLILIHLFRKESFKGVKLYDPELNLTAKVDIPNNFRNQKNISKLDDNNKFIGKKRGNITKSGTKRVVKGYWVLKTSQGRIGKKIVRHFAAKEDLDKLISRINLEHRTLSGKYNTLKIWEVYNLDMFKKEHAKNSDYLKVTDSPYFNFDPYYSSEVKIETTQVN